jgi:hypothetical protein
MPHETGSIPDFSDLNCTNLMIRLKILLKKTQDDTALEFFVRRDQRDTIEEPFSRGGYTVTIRKVEANRFLVTLKKKMAGE